MRTTRNRVSVLKRFGGSNPSPSATVIAFRERTNYFLVMCSCRKFAIVCITMLLCVLVTLADNEGGDVVRLANGRPVRGVIEQVTDDGLVMKSAKGTRTYPWRVLSAGTRYRHQPGYRDTFDAQLKK